MQVTIEKDELVIRVKIARPFMPSKSQKNLLVATSGGIVPTAAMVDGKPLNIGLNAFIGRN